MSVQQANVETLRQAYEKWNETKGGSIGHWLSLVSEDFDFRSLAEGAKGLEFTTRRTSRSEFEGYLNGLVAQLEMIHYTVDEYIADGDRVVAVGHTAWRDRATGACFDTPKVDVMRFADGKIIEFFELYDTAMVLSCSGPDIRKLLEDSYDARRREAVDEVLSYFHPQATFRIVANAELGDLGRQLKGHDELHTAFEDLFTTWDWAQFPIEDTIVEGNKASVRSVGTMQHTPSGTAFEFETLDILTFDDGKIVDFVEYFDTHKLDQVMAGDLGELLDGVKKQILAEQERERAPE